MLYILIFIFGLAVGSFLNVVISRLESEKSIFFDRSRCPECGKVLKWYELVPVFSFILQLGKCRSCGKKISWQYPLVEITTGLLFVLVFSTGDELVFGGSSQFLNLNFEILKFLNLAYLLTITSCFLIIFVYDLEHYIIPDKIVFPAIGVSLIFLLFTNSLTAYGLRLTAAFGASAFFLFLVLATRGKGMGLGDVKLAFLMGLVLGWPDVLIAIMLAVTLGALVGIFLIIFKGKGLKSQIPFGPFLAGSTIFLIIFGDFLNRYLTDLGRCIFCF